MEVPTSENDCTPQKPADATYKEINIDDAIEEHNRGISRAAYIELHRGHSNKLTRNLKKNYEQEKPDEKRQISPRERHSKTRIPIPKPRSLHLSKTKHSNKSKLGLALQRKDENANDVIRKRSSSSEEYITIVLRSESEESLNKFSKELNLFTMDKHPKEKKKGSSFRRILTGKIFTKEKKKKEEEKPIAPPNKENVSLNDNIKNESNDFNRQSNLRHTISSNDPNELRQTRPITKQMEERYAQMHIKEFNQIKNNFENHRTPEKPARPNNLATITYRRFEPRYNDVSSSASTLTSDGTFGENVSSKPELRLVHSNAIIPINSERPLPNPYQFGRNSQEVYNQQLHSTTNSETKLKRSPSIEGSKLKLPQNREATLSRVKSPISQDYNNTDKEIATELLKPKRSPTPNQNLLSLSPTRKAFGSSVDYPESLRNLSPSQQTSSSSVDYRDNISEERRDEYSSQNRQTSSPMVNRDDIYEKMVNEALRPAHDEDKKGSFSALNNIDKMMATQSPSRVHIEDRRSGSLSPSVQTYPSLQENSYGKKTTVHHSPILRTFLSPNSDNNRRCEDKGNNSVSPYDGTQFHSANLNQISRKNVNESLSPTHRMFLSVNNSPCDDTRVSSTDQDPICKINAHTSLSVTPSSSPGHQISMNHTENVDQNNANTNMEPHYSSRFQNRQNQSISRNKLPQYSAGSQNNDMDRDERSSSPGRSPGTSHFSENSHAEEDFWKSRQSADYAAFHSPRSHHSCPPLEPVKQTFDIPEATEDVQRRKMKLTEPRSRSNVNVQQNVPRYPGTERHISKHPPRNENMPYNTDHMTDHLASESRVNLDLYRKAQDLSNQRPRHSEDHRTHPNQFLHTYDNQSKYFHPKDPMNPMSGETRQNREIYPPRNMAHNLQSEERSSLHPINEHRQHANIPSQNMRHSPLSEQHLQTRGIPQRQVFFPPDSQNYGVYKNVPPTANSQRSSTPNNLTPSPLKPVSPQKEDLRRSVEAYYWKEIKKLKEQENMELYYYQMNMVPYMGYAEDPGSLRRSRSLLPTGDRNSRRSLSLPRNVPNDNSNEPVMRHHPVVQPKPVIYQNEPLYGQHFKRNTPERRTIDGSNRTNSIYRPIFKRGSLTTPERQQDDSHYKKVSFRHFEENLPKRQTEQVNSGPRNNIQYPVRYSMNMNDGVYGNPNEIYPRYVQHMQQNRRPNIPEQGVQHITPRIVTRHGSMQLQEGIYDRRPPLARKPSFDGNFARRGAEMPKREIIMGDNEIFGQFGGYLQKEEPTYSGSVISTQESIYGQSRGPKQIVVSDKICDMYGQIHDRNSPSVVRKSGVMIGRLQQQPPQAPTPQPGENLDFLQRNSRLTSSATDIRSRRFPNTTQQQNPNAVYKEGIYSDYPPSRPLPPVPIDARNSPKYGTSDGAKGHRSRSGSASSSVKPKKKGFFGTKSRRSSLEHLETEESRSLSTTELQRLVLLEQLHLIRLQSKLEAEKL